MKNTKSIPFLVLVVILSGTCLFSSAQKSDSNPGAQSEWVYKGTDGKLKYKITPTGDRIMDFSHAGYMGGGVALPVVQVKKNVKPSGGADDTELIQSAVNEVEALPLENGFRGAVLLEPGVFTCSGAISISADGVVLRGSGINKTTLKITGDRHTAIVIGKGRNAQTATEVRNDFKAAETYISDKYVPSGAVSFRIADTKGLAVGDLIEIRKPVTKAWFIIWRWTIWFATANHKHGSAKVQPSIHVALSPKLKAIKLRSKCLFLTLSIRNMRSQPGR
jgi:hypothetical protein